MGYAGLGVGCLAFLGFYVNSDNRFETILPRVRFLVFETIIQHWSGTDHLMWADGALHGLHWLWR